MDRQRRRAAAVVVALALVGAACGGDDVDDPSATGAPDTGTDTGTDVAEPPLVEAPDPDDAPAVTPPAVGGGGGSCTVDVSGDHTASWTGGGTAADVLVSEWFDDAQRSILGDEFSIVLNCTGAGGDYLGFTSGAAADVSSVPVAPAVYELAPATADGSLWMPLVTLADSETNWRVSDDGGTLELTTFDQSRIAGSFEIAMEDALASFGDGTGEGGIVVAGSFDFPRP